MERKKCTRKCYLKKIHFPSCLVIQLSAMILNDLKKSLFSYQIIINVEWFSFIGEIRWHIKIYLEISYIYTNHFNLQMISKLFFSSLHFLREKRGVVKVWHWKKGMFTKKNNTMMCRWNVLCCKGAYYYYLIISFCPSAVCFELHVFLRKKKERNHACPCCTLFFREPGRELLRGRSHSGKGLVDNALTARFRLVH